MKTFNFRLFLIVSLIFVGQTGIKPAASQEKEVNGDQAVKSFVYDDKGRRDPMWELVGPGGMIYNYEKEFALSDLILEGTISDASGRDLAIINGRVVGVNDTVGQYVVLQISKNAVVLEKGTQRFELKLKTEGE